MVELETDNLKGVAEQEELHLRMVATTRSNALIRAYLDGAPDGLTYDRIAAAVKRR